MGVRPTSSPVRSEAPLGQQTSRAFIHLRRRAQTRWRRQENAGRPEVRCQKERRSEDFLAHGRFIQLKRGSISVNTFFNLITTTLLLSLGGFYVKISNMQKNGFYEKFKQF